MLFKYFTNLSAEDNDIASQLESIAPEVELTIQAKIRAKAKMFQLITLDDKRFEIVKGKQINKLVFANFIPRKSLALLLTVIISVGFSVVGIAKADESRPGDILFGVDKFLEEAQLSLTQNSGDKLKLKIVIAEERLTELASLTEELNRENFNNKVDISTNRASFNNDKASSTGKIFIAPHLKDSINQSLVEVKESINRAKEHEVRQNIKKSKQRSSDNSQGDNFVGRIDDLATKEDFLIKNLEIKAKDNKWKLKIKISPGKNKDDDRRKKNNEEKINSRLLINSSSVLRLNQSENEEDDEDASSFGSEATSTSLFNRNSRGRLPRKFLVNRHYEEDRRER